ncbi:zinc finger CCCH domain-containing protein 23-like [Prosopis cineraria]|uniref:zinc finger CCCH domain-containing protein 23-like n=1 Tax=Prosopis cineraria TaxID=364024 RepID=UPI0024102A7B|nr:zinc finger CCCH domain-containing protein 23-like [Prosopis cineraria]
MVIGELACLAPNFQTSHSKSLDGSTIALPIDGLATNINGNTAGCDYPPSIDSSPALHPFLSNESGLTPIDLDSLCEDFDASFDAFSSDQFRIFEFKIRKCARSRSHDWTECPYAHPSEKARRRDPRKYHYSGTACPEFRKGNCKKGDSCEFSHGVFECWLHPSRYRTQFCKDGTNCRRRVCFFAHTPEQLRFLANGSGESLEGSPICHASFVSSPTSVLQPSPISSLAESPPTSPRNPRHGGIEVSGSMRNVQSDKPPPTRVLFMRDGFGSPHGIHTGLVLGSPRGSNLRPGCFSPASTTTRTITRSGLSTVDKWDQSCQEEPAMERVESGRELRAKMYARLCKENSFGRSNAQFSGVF